MTYNVDLKGCTRLTQIDLICYHFIIKISLNISSYQYLKKSGVQYALDFEFKIKKNSF